MVSEEDSNLEPLTNDDINFKSDYVVPRLGRLSDFGLEIYEIIRSRGTLKSKEICQEVFEKSPSQRRLAKINKELRKMRKNGLIFLGDHGYGTIDGVISFLRKNGPSFYHEIAEEFGSGKKYGSNYGLGEFLNILDDHDAIDRFKWGMGKQIFYLPYLEEHKKESRLKGMKHAKKLYEALADGELKNAKQLSTILRMRPKSVHRLINNIEEELDWLSSASIRGKTYENVYFRNDRILESTRKDLEKMKNKTIEEAIKLSVEEPKTINEILEGTELSHKVVSTTIKNLEDEEVVSGVKINPNRYSSMTPTVWFLKTGNEKIDELNEIKASFKSASQKYGSSIFNHLYKNVVSPRKKIANQTGIDIEHLDTPLKILKKYGLVDNVPGLYWYNDRLVDDELLEKISRMKSKLDEGTFEDVIKLYSTVREGMDGFRIKYENSMFIAELMTEMFEMRKKSTIDLQTIATSNLIVVKNRSSYLIPRIYRKNGEKKTRPSGWSWYRDLSKMVKELFNSERVEQ